VERATKGVRVIQWEKDQAEDAGLVKIDLLGNRSLSVIRDACASLREAGGPDIRYDEFDPIDDPRAQELVRDGDTMGVFYVESPAMRQLQQKTRRGDFEHLVIHSSIIRPAANEYIREYVRRLRGGTWTTLHPILDEVLRDSYGIMCYQEDVARVAIRMAGFTDAEADGLRKVLSKKWAGKQVEDFRRRFAEGAAARGIAAGVVEDVWRMILSFSGYSFCKPHSASYALVSFKSAWLKAHHPAEFMAAVLANGGGYYAPFAYVSECRRMGIAALPPDVNQSGLHWTGRSADVGAASAVADMTLAGASAPPASPAPPPTAAPPASHATGRGWVRAGLLEIHGLKEDTAKSILAERDKHGPFASFDDLLRRAPVDPAEARRLVRAGACDVFGSRPRLHWRVQEWEARGLGRRRGTPSLFPPEPAPLPEPRPHDAAKLLRDEEETLGMLLSRHPLTLYREALYALRRSGVQPVRGSDMGRHVGERVTMVGWLVTGKLVTTKDDEPMEFISFEDTTAIYETTFFPRPYARFCRMLSSARPYVLRGRIEEDFGALTLTVEEAEFLDRRPPAISRGGAAAAPAAARPGSPRPSSGGRPAPRPGSPARRA
jgi:error-prone DNA polymerase